ncbi:unnamed protein product [Tuber melanosporum]|uniref:(Perigord truffle) hypothetical protein n=1 Tax=Tuber melanosporum (strain Mel28) TaxID=656061 RepID=D5GKE4_TUBMM|nr:uncharacterized protein GSTUM_00009501001 [Tuber melanosporum]CAZ84987.1 unnamed protein product [Tuber melanosporum]
MDIYNAFRCEHMAKQNEKKKKNWEKGKKGHTAFFYIFFYEDWVEEKCTFCSIYFFSWCVRGGHGGGVVVNFVRRS